MTPTREDFDDCDARDAEAVARMNAAFPWSNLWLVALLGFGCALAAAVLIGLAAAIVTAVMAHWWLLIPVALVGVVGAAFAMLGIGAGV